MYGGVTVAELLASRRLFRVVREMVIESAQSQQAQNDADAWQARMAIEQARIGSG